MNQNSALGFRLYGTGYAKLPTVPPKPKTIQRKKKIGKLWLVTIFSSTSGKMSAFSCLLSCLEETFGTDLIKEYLVLDYYLDYLKQVRRLSIS